MDNDQFAGVQSINQEISQASYVEIISVKYREEPAIGNNNSVDNSLNSLAYNLARGKPQTTATSSLYNYTSGVSLSATAKASKTSLASNIVKQDALGNGVICGLENLLCAEPSDCAVDIAFVLDDTGSMADVIKDVKEGLSQVAGLIQTISNQDYRMGLITFKDCFDNGSVQIIPRLKFGNCGNINELITALDTVEASGGMFLAEASNIAVQQTITGELLGNWRSNTKVKKLIILITDAPPGGCEDRWSELVGTHFRNIAQTAANCGIKIVSLLVDRDMDTTAPEYAIFKEVAEISGGIYKLTTGSDIAELLVSYIFSLCGQEPIANEPECGPSKNLVLNGEFDTSIFGWEEAAPTVTWNFAGALELDGTPLIKASTYQTINGLIAGTRISLGLDVKGLTGDKLYYGILSGDNSVNEEYTLDTDGVYVRLITYADVQPNGSVIIYMESNDNILIDNVYVCQQPTASCGSGRINAVSNPDFKEGVEFWSNDVGPLTPTDDPNYWNADTRSAILSIDGTLKIKQTVEFNAPVTLQFNILENEPYDIKELGLRYRIYEGDSTNPSRVILDKVVTNADIDEFPYTITEEILASSSSATIEFSTGPGANPDGISGYTTIKAISLCSRDPLSCPFDMLDRTDFSSGRNGWAGGEIDIPNENLKLTRTKAKTSKTFTNLTPGSKVSLSYYSKSTRSDIGTRFTLLSGGVKVYDDGTVFPKEIEIQNDGTLYVDIQMNSIFSLGEFDNVVLDNILLCIVYPTSCNGSVSGLSAAIEWQTIPPREVNVITAFLKCTTRDYLNPEITSVKYIVPLESRLGIEVPTNCQDGKTCDFWKQQGSTNGAEINIFKDNLDKLTGKNLTLLPGIEPGKLENIEFPIFGSISNMVWAIPASKTQVRPDRLVMLADKIARPNGDIEANVESITVYMLMNQIVPSNGEQPYSCGPLEDYLCKTDQDGFDVVLSYTNSKNVFKEFRQRINRNELYTIEAPLPGFPANWDLVQSTGNGVRGEVAKWMAVTFDLDTVDGKGLDQCSKPIGPFIYNGSGSIQFNNFALAGSSRFIDPCDAEVKITAVSDGSRLNEKQSITLPNPKGGTWSLTLRVYGESRVLNLSALIDAAQLQSALEILDIVGAGNVVVVGSGTPLSPFIVEFVNDLAGANIPIMEANGDNLLGAASGIVQTIRDGTLNERQRIEPAVDNMESLTLTFNGSTSSLIAYNASLDEIQAAIEAMDTVGVGNVIITGDTTARDIPYIGPFNIDFVGSLSSTNVPQMAASPSGNWSALTVYNGGPPGTDELQSVTIDAVGGTFTLKIYDPENPAVSYTTDSIAYNANAAVLKESISNAPFMQLSDITVTKTEAGSTRNKWEITFSGSKAAKDFKQMEIDTSSLMGGVIIVNEAQQGGYTPEKQRLQIIRASAGYFNLRITVDGVTEVTDNIIWNTSADGLREDIATHSKIDIEHVIVIDETPTDPEVVAQFLVTIGRIGNMPLMVPIFQESLLCNPIVLEPVPEPPYNYPLDQYCDIASPPCAVNPCLPGPLPTKPCEGDSPLPIDPCCDPIRESANISKRFIYQRDLISPNSYTTDCQQNKVKKYTVKDVAVSKGLRPSNYTPYLRDIKSGTMTKVEYSLEVQTGMSIVLVDSAIADSSIYNITSYLKRTKGILPSRMVWPTNRLPQLN
jgi:hypothetical protein